MRFRYPSTLSDFSSSSISDSESLARQVREKSFRARQEVRQEEARTKRKARQERDEHSETRQERAKHRRKPARAPEEAAAASEHESRYSKASASGSKKPFPEAAPAETANPAPSEPPSSPIKRSLYFIYNNLVPQLGTSDNCLKAHGSFSNAPGAYPAEPGPPSSSDVGSNEDMTDNSGFDSTWFSTSNDSSSDTIHSCDLPTGNPKPSCHRHVNLPPRCEHHFADPKCMNRLNQARAKAMKAEKYAQEQEELKQREEYEQDRRERKRRRQEKRKRKQEREEKERVRLEKKLKAKERIKLEKKRLEEERVRLERERQEEERIRLEKVRQEEERIKLEKVRQEEERIRLEKVRQEEVERMRREALQREEEEERARASRFQEARREDPPFRIRQDVISETMREAEYRRQEERWRKARQAEDAHMEEERRSREERRRQKVREEEEEERKRRKEREEEERKRWESFNARQRDRTSKTRSTHNRSHPYARSAKFGRSHSGLHFNPSDAEPAPAVKNIDPLVAHFEWYEAQWNDISSLSNKTPLTFATIPWPLLIVPRTPEDVTAVRVGEFMCHTKRGANVSTGKELRFLAMKELKNWHPDKFTTRVLPRIINDAERAVVRAAADVVQKALTDLKSAN